MSDHQFIVGQSVRFKGRHSFSPVAAEMYRVTRTLPTLNNSPQYRIRNEDESHDRVATEDKLEKVDLPGGLEDVFRK